ncbi:hypothetical protein ABZ766_20900 [Streptomyces sp. NPDC006670]|uniref:hypothetical protein n=1 Tax=Streptomyces sp. NPDC006670 TaxID=3154476 RepID=UPI0034118786
MHRLVKASIGGFALVALSATPALADSNGRYDISQGTNANAYGNYIVNERAGDTRVWLKGTLHKNYNAGCDWVEVGGTKLAQMCGATGYHAIDGYHTYGILDSAATVKVCHDTGEKVLCASKKISW